MSDFIAAFPIVVAFVIAVAVFIVCAFVLSSRRLKRKRRMLGAPYREIICIIEKFPVYGPKDTVYFLDKDEVRPKAMNYETARHFLEEEIEKRKAERDKAFKKYGPGGSGREITMADCAVQTLWSIENDERRYRKALAELNAWTEKYSDRLNGNASRAVMQSLGRVYDVIEDAYEKGNFLSTDGDQSRNRLKAAEKELAENMENDIDLAII